ncbi:hypothetical protein Tco_0037619, partial [Tanacetum coccineum]
ADIPKAVLLPRKRLCLTLGPRFEVGESSSATAARPTRGYRVDYRFIGTLDAEDTDETYVQFEDAQDDRALLKGQVNMLRRDRQYHLNTTMLVESEARVARETTSLQTQLIAALGRIDTLEAREPAHIDDPEDADSYS